VVNYSECLSFSADSCCGSPGRVKRQERDIPLVAAEAANQRGRIGIPHGLEGNLETLCEGVPEGYSDATQLARPWIFGDQDLIREDEADTQLSRRDQIRANR